MKTFSARAGLSLVLLSLCLAAGCARNRAQQQTAVAQEQSVKPGINTEYLKPDLNPSNWVERFEREGREIFDQREQIVAAIKIRPGTTVADIGSGTGLFTPMLAKAVGPKGKVYAVDIVPKFLELIRQRAEAAGTRNVQTVLCTERSVNLPANSIHQAFMCDVYHHFEYPKQSLASLHQALRKGGEVFVIDFQRESDSSEWVRNHVRAGKQTVIQEFEAAGFAKVEEHNFLKENYAIRFRKK